MGRWKQIPLSPGKWGLGAHSSLESLLRDTRSKMAAHTRAPLSSDYPQRRDDQTGQEWAGRTAGGDSIETDALVRGTREG